MRHADASPGNTDRGPVRDDDILTQNFADFVRDCKGNEKGGGRRWKKGNIFRETKRERMIDLGFTGDGARVVLCFLRCNWISRYLKKYAPVAIHILLSLSLSLATPLHATA